MRTLRLQIPFLFSLLIFSSVAYCQSDWPILKNVEYKFWLAYPPNWTVVTTETPNSIGAVASPNGKYVGVCNIGISRSPQTQAKTQVQLNKEIDAVDMKPSQWLRNLQGTFPDVKVSETQKVKLQNRPAHSVVMEASYEDLGRTSFVHNILVTTLTPGFVWNLTCGTSARSATDARDAFDYWRPTFAGILRTFFIEQQ